MDPAGPGFSSYMDRVRDVARLSRDSADLVDVIHTDGTGFMSYGLLEPLGHMDFYPNGGAWQPGCLTYAAAMGDDGGKNIMTSYHGNAFKSLALL